MWAAPVVDAGGWWWAGRRLRLAPEADVDFRPICTVTKGQPAPQGLSAQATSVPHCTDVV